MNNQQVLDKDYGLLLPLLGEGLLLSSGIISKHTFYSLKLNDR